jgi:DNA-binding transcriptional MerR regulator
MADDGLLSIGRFAVATGLSITTLRYYDDVGLLRPAAVDAETAYRRYAAEQIPQARMIRALRSIELPLDAIRDALADPDAVPDLLVAHREQLVTTVKSLDEYIKNGLPMKSTATGCRVAEVNIIVDDLHAACAFYARVFEIEFVEEHHDNGPVHAMATFGSWPGNEFFLLNISAVDDPHRRGRADFGFLVDDLEAVHQRAIEAGAFELMPPHDASGMPRCSGFCDPSGNVVNLYQNV